MTVAMTFGIHVGQQNVSLPELRRLWRFADRSGFDWVSGWDHFQESPPKDGSGDCFEAVTTMALLAADTERVRVGCLVFCVGYRHPAVLANALVTIDHISNGRMECGLGAGWHEAEHRAYGIPFEPIGVREDKLEEAAQVIRLLFTRDVANFKGAHFQLDEARCNPRPVQASPRIWIGGIGEKRTLRAVARHADGWNATYVSPEVFRDKSRILDDWCAEERRDPGAILRTANVGFYMGATEAAAERNADEMRAEWGAQLERRKGFLTGTPRQVMDQVAGYREVGAARLNLVLRAPFDWDALHAFVEEVLPVFGVKPA
jgi:alkanesulfonate monooxygenase SsuD/methylene tetrahydromethanopterin reductase-like flavin-dependent oxidoreductase (luciferase family)